MPQRLASRITPSQVLVLGFATLIFLGAMVLMLPVSSASGQWTNFIDALFTATSAVCVTGLVVVDTGSFWSPFGQVVVLLLIQIGGLGIMTVSTLFFFLIGKRITLRERLVMQESLGGGTLAGLVRLTREVLLVTLVVETLGTAFLTGRWALDYPLGQALYLGVFHAVSAFNNAGFDLFGSSLVGYVDDAVTILTVGGLIIAGGLGFTVILELWHRRRGQRLSLHAKLVLAVTAGLILAGALLIFLFEASNPRTMGPLSFRGRLLAAFFHSVTPRTAGFNSLVTGNLREATLLLTIILMFIGASPASTGGGIKTSTFGTLLLAIRATIRGDSEPLAFGRRIPRGTVQRALAITLMAGALVLGITTVLLLTEGSHLLETLFEVTSAFGTVGLSTGLTPRLSPEGRLLISLTMYIGRVGPLTLAYSLVQAATRRRTGICYPEDRVMVG